MYCIVCSSIYGGPDGTMSCVVGLPNISYKPLTNTRGLASGFVNYKKGCTRLAATNDKAYQLLVHGRWFSPSTSAFFITKTGRHDIAEILLKRAASGDVTSGCACAMVRSSGSSTNTTLFVPIYYCWSFFFMKHSWTNSLNLSFSLE